MLGTAVRVEFYIVYVAYLVAVLIDLLSLGSRGQVSTRLARWTIVGAVVLHTLALFSCLAWYGSSAIVSPFGTLLGLTWAVVVLMLLVRFRRGVTIHEPVLLLLVCILLTVAHARSPGSASLAAEYTQGLGAFLFPIHIIACFLGYAAFANACAVSAEYLALHYALKHRNLGLFQDSRTSLDSLDRTNTWLLTIGSAALASGVVIGGLWLWYIGSTQHGMRKILFTLVILCVYVSLLIIRRYALLVGRRMAWASIGALGFVAISLLLVR